jgi:hypothetical protein
MTMDVAKIAVAGQRALHSYGKQMSTGRRQAWLREDQPSEESGTRSTAVAGHNRKAEERSAAEIAAIQLKANDIIASGVKQSGFIWRRPRERRQQLSLFVREMTKPECEVWPGVSISNTGSKPCGGVDLGPPHDSAGRGGISGQMGRSTTGAADLCARERAESGLPEARGGLERGAINQLSCLVYTCAVASTCMPPPAGPHTQPASACQASGSMRVAPTPPMCGLAEHRAMRDGSTTSPTLL